MVEEMTEVKGHLPSIEQILNESCIIKTNPAPKRGI